MILFDQKSFSLSPNLIYNKIAMKRIYLLLALFMGVCAFSACSDDNKEDEKDDEKTYSLVGTWDLIHDWWEDSKGKVSDNTYFYPGLNIYIFEADGKGTAIYTGDGIPEEFTFTYTYENKILTVVYEEVEEGTGKGIYNVTIKDNIMKLKTTEVDESKMYECLELKKIK